MYTPDPKSLVYSQLQFISTSVPMPQAEISLEIEKIYDDVATEILALFVGIESEVETEVVRNYTVSLHLAQEIEIAN
jgi:hypothetical protein